METATRADRYTWQDKRVWFDVIGARSGAVPGPQSSHRRRKAGT